MLFYLISNGEGKEERKVGVMRNGHWLTARSEKKSWWWDMFLPTYILDRIFLHPLEDTMGIWEKEKQNLFAGNLFKDFVKSWQNQPKGIVYFFFWPFQFVIGRLMRRVWSRRLMWSVLISCSPPHKSPIITHARSSMLLHLLWDTSPPTTLFHLLPCTSQRSILCLNNTYTSPNWYPLLLLWQCLTTTKEQRDRERKKN